MADALWESRRMPAASSSLPPLQLAGDARGSGLYEACHEGLRRGQRVEMRGLKAKPELNGAVGELVRFDPQSGRWHLQLLSGFETLKVRPDNLQPEDCLDAADLDAEDVQRLVTRTEDC
eukprot:TRINITY_DN25647_c0_g1_i1.p2 TRINITY_DN25647_c0_g1~~TRINITY_DN25647_c0_g1_i1.p2  ORF type:complete len:119 (+),score=30.51 TRINITY_DN25647_c0_g1_i1:60-416(+)